jgi:hypothetical protein
MEMDRLLLLLCMRMAARGNHNSKEIPLQKLVYVSDLQYIVF